MAPTAGDQQVLKCGHAEGHTRAERRDAESCQRVIGADAGGSDWADGGGGFDAEGRSRAKEGNGAEDGEGAKNADSCKHHNRAKDTM